MFHLLICRLKFLFNSPIPYVVNIHVEFQNKAFEQKSPYYTCGCTVASLNSVTRFFYILACLQEVFNCKALIFVYYFRFTHVSFRTLTDKKMQAKHKAVG